MDSSLNFALGLFSLILFYLNSMIPLIWPRAAGCKTQTIFIGNESAVNAGCLGEWECQLPWVSPSLDCCRCRRGGGCTSVCCHVVTTQTRSHTPTEEQREERSEERTSASRSLHDTHKPLIALAFAWSLFLGAAHTVKVSSWERFLLSEAFSVAKRSCSEHDGTNLFIKWTGGGNGFNSSQPEL